MSIFIIIGTAAAYINILIVQARIYKSPLITMKTNNLQFQSAVIMIIVTL